MKKRTRNKVIIITTIICILVVGIFVFNHLQNMKPIDNSYQDYIAVQTIDLPNGSSSAIQLTTNEQNIQGSIGANLSDLTQAIKQNLNYDYNSGVYVQDTLRDSPAQTAGILPGDIITKIDEQETLEVLPTIKLISSLNPGNAYQFTVFRQGKYLDYLVTITPKA